MIGCGVLLNVTAIKKQACSEFTIRRVMLFLLHDNHGVSHHPK